MKKLITLEPVIEIEIPEVKPVKEAWTEIDQDGEVFGCFEVDFL